jgi:hypothetical protein
LVLLVWYLWSQWKNLGMIFSDHDIKPPRDGAGGLKGGAGVAVGAVMGLDRNQ